MLSHVHVGVEDLDRALAFYSVLLPMLGWRLKFVDEDRSWAGWQPADAERPLVLVGRPLDGKPAAAGNGQMVAFLAPSRRAVDAFHQAALALGASDAGGPGPRPAYHADFYGAYVRDPDGNKLCVCCHEPG